MRRTAIAISLFLIAGMAHAQVATQCGSLAAPQALPIQSTVIAPIAPELIAPSHQLGAPTGVLAHAFDEAQSVDQVLFRIRIENCQSLASVTPVTTPGAMPTATDPAAYKPQTEFDNTPWRFDMNQNGKQMTADEFTAWMKSKGVRVARGAARPTGVATPPIPAPAAAGMVATTPASTEVMPTEVMPTEIMPTEIMPPEIAPIEPPPTEGGDE